ncbi:vitamin K epoxide reductase family protein [Flavobacterium inviolabile]|uniref:vitamin K epoxide reductase family protein n=1 Tax=Flavobacterium inviolabile TaxID=2748320 RepID=UPI0015ABAD20|nr:vitamin K epoxide reductase family protein [Flavobacterium inviolabile]
MHSFLNLINDFLNKNLHFLDKEDLNLQLLSHEDYPSFRSVSDTFDYFGIENLVANVPVDALEQLPEYFMALINVDKKDVIVSIHKTKSHIKCKSADGKKSAYSYPDFKKIWPGTIIAVEKNEKPESKRETSTLLAFGCALVLSLLLFAFPFSLPVTALGVLSALGIFLSVLIIKEELGIHDNLSSRICSSLNEKGSCSKIITSSVQFLGVISLSNATAVFFISQFLILLFAGFDSIFFTALLLSSIPVLLFSLYSQAFILKQWCALCLGIVLILLAEIATVFSNIAPFEINSSYILKALLIITLTYLGVFYTKALLTKSIALKKTKIDFLKFKRNQGLFSTLLHKKQLEKNNSIPQEYILSFGSKNPVLTINAVTNPLCGYCTDAFKAYYNLLEKHGNDIQINFVLSVPFERTDNVATKIAASFSEAYSGNKDTALSILKEWFDEKDIPQWENRSVPVHQHTLDLLTAHRTWCDNHSIHYTPATFINGYHYPAEYTLQEFSLFAEQMIEQLREDTVLVYQN